MESKAGFFVAQLDLGFSPFPVLMGILVIHQFESFKRMGKTWRFFSPWLRCWVGVTLMAQNEDNGSDLTGPKNPKIVAFWKGVFNGTPKIQKKSRLVKLC